MTLNDHFALLERYNRWFNGQILQACAELSDTQRKRDQGAYFGSIHGTLNHILLADQLWLGRFTQTPVQFPSLDAQLHADFDELVADRQATDLRIHQLVRSEILQQPQLAFTDSFGVDRTIPMHQALGHLFNHATHHRGQITTLLFQQGVDVGITDLARMPADFV